MLSSIQQEDVLVIQYSVTKIEVTKIIYNFYISFSFAKEFLINSLLLIQKFILSKIVIKIYMNSWKLCN